MKTSYRTALRFAVFAIAALSGGLFAHAQAKYFYAPAASDVEDPSQSILALGVNSPLEIQLGELVIADAGRQYVRFTPDAKSIRKGTSYVAFAPSEDGSPRFGTVESDPGLLAAESRLKVCSLQPKLHASGLEQRALFESLIDIRSRRREIFEKKLQDLLTPELATKLAKLERNFGLQVDSPLSATLHPASLAYRLERLKFAIDLYHSSQQTREASRP